MTKCIIILFFLISEVFAQEIKIYPSAEETLCLEYINYLRSKPTMADLYKRLKYLELEGQKKIGSFNRQLFEKEYERLQKQNPLFMDIFLLKSARNHSLYMISNGQSHEENHLMPNFTGLRFHERILFEKSNLIGFGENCYLESYGPEHSMLAFLIDWGQGVGNMQDGRPHRKNLFLDDAKLVGCGVIPYENKMAVTQVFSYGIKDFEYVGGVIYCDRNENGFYDLDEGLGGFDICISVKGKTFQAQSYPSGLYVLPIEMCNEFEQKFQFNKYQHIDLIKKSKGNKKNDLILDVNTCDQLYQCTATSSLALNDFAWDLYVLNIKGDFGKNVSEILLAHKHVVEYTCSLIEKNEITLLNQFLADQFKVNGGQKQNKWLQEVMVYLKIYNEVQIVLKQSTINKLQLYEILKKMDTIAYTNREIDYYLNRLRFEIKQAISNSEK